MKKTCPDDDKGCGRTLEENKDNFRVYRHKLDTGRTVARFGKYCRDCDNKERREKRRKQLQGYKLREMECIPEMNDFLYGGR